MPRLRHLWNTEWDSEPAAGMAWFIRPAETSGEIELTRIVAVIADQNVSANVSLGHPALLSADSTDSGPVFCRRSVRKVTRHSRVKKSLHREKGRPLDRAAVMGKMGAVKPIFKEGT
jgi:hypothetical protein